MSYRFLNAVLYNKTEDELISDLNSVRDDYHKYISKLIKQHAETYIDFGDRKYKPDEDENGTRLLSRAIRTIEKGANTLERGNPVDFSGNCVVLKAQGKIVLWFFGGYHFDDFRRQNKILKVLKDFSYMSSSDIEFESEEEEKEFESRGDFWYYLLDKYDTSIPSRMGLVYEFFTHEDIWDFACELKDEYEKAIGKKSNENR